MANFCHSRFSLDVQTKRSNLVECCGHTATASCNLRPRVPLIFGCESGHNLCSISGYFTPRPIDNCYCGLPEILTTILLCLDRHIWGPQLFTASLTLLRGWSVRRFYKIVFVAYIFIPRKVSRGKFAKLNHVCETHI